MKIGNKVIATITKNGYFINSYNGVIVGFTNNGRVKVSSYRGVRVHSQDNVEIIK